MGTSLGRTVCVDGFGMARKPPSARRARGSTCFVWLGGVPASGVVDQANVVPIRLVGCPDQSRGEACSPAGFADEVADGRVEAGDVVGGRTASWVQDGMPVESGLHRFLGFYEELPAHLRFGAGRVWSTLARAG
jgi:hypothetical protein